MKRFVALVVLMAVLLAAPVAAAPTHTFDGEDVSVMLTDEPCENYAKKFIQPEWVPYFKQFSATANSAEAREVSGGLALVVGCYSDHPELAPPGMIVFINELGGTGFDNLSDYTSVRKGMAI